MDSTSFKITGYSLENFPGVLDDDFRLLAFLKDFHYADSFLYYSEFDLDIRDYSWIRYEDFRLFVVYVCSDTEHVEPGQILMDGVDVWLVLGDYIVFVPHYLLIPEIRRLVDRVACRFYDSED